MICLYSFFMTAKTEVMTTKQNISINIVFSWSHFFFLVLFNKIGTCRADNIRKVLFLFNRLLNIDKEMLELDEDPISEIPSANSATILEYMTNLIK